MNLMKSQKTSTFSSTTFIKKDKSDNLNPNYKLQYSNYKPGTERKQNTDNKSSNSEGFLARALSNTKSIINKIINFPKDQKLHIINDKYVYHEDDLVGKGYSSHVYKCSNINNIQNKNFAVKILDLSRIKGFLYELLKKEISIHKNLNHENIVKCFDIIQTQTHIYLIQEFCSGGDLATYISQRKKKITEGEALKVMSQITEGYKYLIKQKILHRDLKPCNIFRCGKDKTWKIGDFGFSCQSFEQSDDVNVGTPIYMPPESLEKSVYSHKSDFFALGVIMFQMIYGKVPWFSKSQSLLVKKMRENRLNLMSQKPEISNGLIRRFIERCCEIEKQNRITEDQFIKMELYPKEVVKLRKNRNSENRSELSGSKNKRELKSRLSKQKQRKSELVKSGLKSEENEKDEEQNQEKKQNVELDKKSKRNRLPSNKLQNNNQVSSLLFTNKQKQSQYSTQAHTRVIAEASNIKMTPQSSNKKINENLIKLNNNYVSPINLQKNNNIIKQNSNSKPSYQLTKTSNQHFQTPSKKLSSSKNKQIKTFKSNFNPPLTQPQLNNSETNFKSLSNQQAFKENNEILYKQIQFCKHLYYMIKNIKYFNISSLKKDFFVLVIYKHIIYLLKKLKNNKFNYFELAKWEIYKQSKYYIAINKEVSVDLQLVQKQYLKNLKHKDIKLLRDVNSKFPQLSHDAQFNMKFYNKISEWLKQLIHEFNQNNMRIMEEQIKQKRIVYNNNKEELVKSDEIQRQGGKREKTKLQDGIIKIGSNSGVCNQRQKSKQSRNSKKIVRESKDKKKIRQETGMINQEQKKTNSNEQKDKAVQGMTTGKKVKAKMMKSLSSTSKDEDNLKKDQGSIQIDRNSQEKANLNNKEGVNENNQTEDCTRMYAKNEIRRQVKVKIGQEMKQRKLNIKMKQEKLQKCNENDFQDVTNEGMTNVENNSRKYQVEKKYQRLENQNLDRQFLTTQSQNLILPQLLSPSNLQTQPILYQQTQPFQDPFCKLPHPLIVALQSIFQYYMIMQSKITLNQDIHTSFSVINIYHQYQDQNILTLLRQYQKAKLKSEDITKVRKLTRFI